VINELSSSVGEVWGAVAIKAFTATVSDQYALEFLHRDSRSRVSNASTGEKQVLALAFVAALVRRALTQTFDELQQTGHVFPLMIDSPFGALEREYRRDVAEWICKLAPQVILLVSQSQWETHTESAVKDRVGAAYVLRVVSKGARTQSNVTVHGQDMIYVEPGFGELNETFIDEVRV